MKNIVEMVNVNGELEINGDKWKMEKIRSDPHTITITVSPSSEFPELYYILVELSCFVEPLFPLPASLFLPIREGSGGHHDGKLLGYSSLEGVYQNAVIIDSAVCLGQFESSGVFVEVSIELIHAEGIDGLVGSILDVLWDKGFFEGLA